MKVVAVIVVFNPDYNQLIGNLNRLVKQVDQILLYQNSLLEQDCQILDQNNVIILGTGENLGIGKALNESAKWAVANSYDFLLTMDQDSYFTDSDFEQYKLYLSKYGSDHSIGVFGPNINNRNNLLYTVEEEHIQVAETITSGSIFPVRIFKNQVFFDEDLFIDAVDYEFCFRLNENYNLRTIVFPKVLLHHEVGENLKTWLGFRTDNYSAFRTYYIIRNQLIIWKRYPKLFSSLYKKTYVKGHLFGRIVKIVLAEKNKNLKLKAIFMGFVHGLKGKTGFYHIK